ncbi:MAG: DMT family transporter [Alphaproteobacteria bacterium]|jgi:drug/metabolite transporter (DMT)-like permease
MVKPTIGGGKQTLILATAMVIIGGVIWGGTFTLAKLITESGVHPFGLALLTSLTGAAFLLPYSVIRHGGVPLARDYVQVYFIAGIVGTALPSSVLFYVAAQMPAGILAIIVSLVPLMSYALALLFGVERLEALRVAGTGLGFAAVLMILIPDTSLPDPSMALWAMLALIAPLSYSVENIYIAIRRPPKSNPFVLLGGMMGVASLILLPLVWVNDAWVPFDVLIALPLWWIPTLSLINIVGYVLFLELIVMTGPLFAAQMGYAVTISGVLWGIVIFGEAHSAWVWAALAVMFAGIAMVHPSKERPSPP